jgi:diaminohydroxyphosphoribosylaminopyrimidine deaminase/5-amino-6-(5-phosphoribosylamino)uracil reductase
MLQCLSLAEKGAGAVAPNPMVGAVLVYNHEVISAGYHEQFGGPHAEVNCIRSVSAANQSLIPLSTLYVSLEPCNHTGKTPPCTDLILSSGIKKVVIACVDSSSKVNGKGIAQLSEHGVEVIVGVEEQKALELNKRFFTFHQQQRPFVILKWAQSVEGIIGLKDQRVLLSTEECNVVTHQWRAEESAIWVGYNTAALDNPQLNVRLVEGNNPIRIVYDKELSLSDDLHLFDGSIPTLRFNKTINHQKGNIEWIQIEPEKALVQILEQLRQRQILSVIIEGGTKLLQQFIDDGLWDEVRVIQTATNLSDGVKAPVLKQAVQINHIQVGVDQIYFYKKQ